MNQAVEAESFMALSLMLLLMNMAPAESDEYRPKWSLRNQLNLTEGITVMYLEDQLVGSVELVIEPDFQLQPAIDAIQPTDRHFVRLL